jgi:hypothetical protein
MIDGPDCPVCGWPMRFFVVEEPLLPKRSHFECLVCDDDIATNRADLRIASRVDVGSEKGPTNQVATFAAHRA